ncbi:MAG: family 78 glycoside hydrolase catalytic domain [Oscillospiraceae bacterium]|nr:family 78 glycoside hydrolase catalytic domain [Oscillospiraceae bacterium]
MLLDSKWLAYTTGEYKDRDAKYGNPSPYFRKAFALQRLPVRAELLISALGVYKVYINGTPAGQDWLSPGWVDYSKKLPLLRYDVTGLIRPENAIGVVLGDGWAVGHIGSEYTFKRNNYTDRLEFTLTLRLQYADGSCEEIRSDESWKAAKGEILRSDIYMGEYTDRRLSLGAYSCYDYDDSGWDAAEVPPFKFSRNLFLEELDVPPVTVKHTFTPAVIGRSGNAVLYDVGQNIAGVLRVRARGAAGAKLVLRHGEMLQDGALYTANLRQAEATDTCILCGSGEEEFRPLFTYHGFRYAEITVEGEAELLSVTAEAMYTDLAETGSFSCSDALVNRVFQNALWGQRDNFYSVPTDCPQRDERLGWTCDAQIFCQSACYNMDCSKYFRKYLADVRDAQLGNGVIPAVAPLPRVYHGYAYTGYDAAAGWSECIGEIPYTHYKMYGDKAVLRENLPALKALLAYYEKDSTGYLRDGSKMYGDWLSAGEISDKSVIANLYFARAAWYAAHICRLVNDEQAVYYDELYAKVRAAFRAAYYKDGRLLSDTQSVYVLGYRFGLLSAEEARPNLQRKLEATNCHLTTGFLGVKYLLPVLCDLGMVQQAYRVLTQRDYPGWGYSVVNGATTIWEHWDSYTQEKGFLPGMNSFNHFSLGSCVEWMYEYCLGIRPDDTAGGCSRVLFCPQFDFEGGITAAQGHYDSVRGRITAAWQWQGDGVNYTVTVPAAVKAQFAFPGCTVEQHTAQGETHSFLLRRAAQ